MADDYALINKDFLDCFIGLIDCCYCVSMVEVVKNDCFFCCMKFIVVNNNVLKSLKK